MHTLHHGAGARPERHREAARDWVDTYHGDMLMVVIGWVGGLVRLGVVCCGLCVMCDVVVR